MLGRHLWAVAAVWLVVGCAATTPEVETRSYTLQNRVAEEALIKGKLDDEAARLGNERMAKMVQRAGGTLDTFKVVDDNTAIVRTTSRGHSEIEGRSAGKIGAEYQGAGAARSGTGLLPGAGS